MSKLYDFLHPISVAEEKEVVVSRRFVQRDDKGEPVLDKNGDMIGLMLTEKGPRVLEYNARFGDPETPVVLPRMKNDLIDVVEACVDGTLDQVELEFEDNAAVCVVLASDGYPVHYEKGFPIRGLERFEGADGYYVFHAGTKFDAEGRVVTNGGRVLGVTATGGTLKEARRRAYEATEWVAFDNKYMRHDIGKAIDEA